MLNRLRLSSASPQHEASHLATPIPAYQTITEGLTEIYNQYVVNMERDFKFDQFYSPELTEGDFQAKPIVLLLGQYSTGKTTFIRHLLKKDYPGLRIGPEPTTDKFVAVCHKEDSTESGNSPAQVLQGNAAMVNHKLPWHQLTKFGSGFINRFEVVHCGSERFKGVTLVDTPGVLAGSKQWERGYDFEGVIKWFAERVDSVLIFFDAHKLDISDEFRRCILALRGNESKVSILLNKADSVNSQHLMRVYGALMWSLGKVMSAPEVPRIYIGSFWDQPLRRVNDDESISPNENSASGHSGHYREERSGSSVKEMEIVARLFKRESKDLFNLLYSLPARSASRKIDDFLKRAKKCHTHCVLMDYLRRQLPQFIGKSYKQKELLEHLDEIYEILSRKYQISVQDFPPADFVRSKMQDAGALSKFPKADPKKLRDLDEKVKERVAILTRLIPKEEAELSVDNVNPATPPLQASPKMVLRPATAATTVSCMPNEFQRPASAAPDCVELNSESQESDSVGLENPNFPTHPPLVSRTSTGVTPRSMLPDDVNLSVANDDVNSVPEWLPPIPNTSKAEMYKLAEQQERQQPLPEQQ